MIETLEVIDGLSLPEEYRKLLRPDEAIADAQTRTLRLPRFFYRVATWQQAREMKLTPHFTLAELMAVDCREAPLLLRTFPHYVPCAVSVLARYLEEFRTRAGAPVMICINGAYRSAAHTLSRTTSPHLWATAADIYRIGDTWLDSSKTIERFARIAESLGQEVFVKPFGHDAGETDDHLHFDIGYIDVAPRSP